MPFATLGSRESGVGRGFGDVYSGITLFSALFPSHQTVHQPCIFDSVIWFIFWSPTHPSIYVKDGL